MAVRIHILYVGRGDSVIVEFSNGKLVMVDSHSFPGSPNPVNYLEKNFPGRSLSLMVLTHPHPHRMKGLAEIRQKVNFESFWDTSFWDTRSKNGPELRIANWQQDPFKTDWDDYQKIRLEIYPEIKVSSPLRGYKLNIAEDEAIEVLAPTKDLRKKALQTGDAHYSSFVLRIKCGQNRVILGGSANKEVWEDIYNHYGEDLKANFLLASHHGHLDGYHKSAIKAIYPDFVVISSEVESYGDAAGLYGRYCSNGVISTAHLGNIVASCFPSGGVELKTQY